MKKILLILFFIASMNAHSATIAEVQVTCPIGGEKFKSILAGSGTQFGVGLDLKPTGAIIAPHPLSKCPSNGFVVFNKNLSNEELQILEPYVNSNEYQIMQKTETDYFLAAKLMSQLKEPDESIAFVLLKSTWEATNDEQYQRYADESLAVYKNLLNNPKNTVENKLMYKQLIVELLRRVKRFEQAQKAVNDLLKDEDIEGTLFKQLANQELELIKAKDSEFHRFKRDKQNH